jgi:hypothetical protein
MYSPPLSCLWLNLTLVKGGEFLWNETSALFEAAHARRAPCLVLRYDCV